MSSISDISHKLLPYYFTDIHIAVPDKSLELRTLFVYYGSEIYYWYRYTIKAAKSSLSVSGFCHFLYPVYLVTPCSYWAMFVDNCYSVRLDSGADHVFVRLHTQGNDCICYC